MSDPTGSAPPNKETLEREDHIKLENNDMSAVVIDLTQSSDENESSRDPSEDSDLEVISLNSSTVISVQLENADLQNYQNSANLADIATDLSRSFVLPSNDNSSNTQRRHLSLSPVTHLSARTAMGTESIASASSSIPYYNRPREDVIDWLADIEPFDPGARSTLLNCNIDGNSSNSNLHCRHCGQRFQAARSSVDCFCTSNRNMPCHQGRGVEPRSQDNSVLERMLSTPPLPNMELNTQRPVFFLNPFVQHQTNISRPTPNYRYEHVAPPPAHSDNYYLRTRDSNTVLRNEMGHHSDSRTRHPPNAHGEVSTSNIASQITNQGFFPHLTMRGPVPSHQNRLAQPTFSESYQNAIGPILLPEIPNFQILQSPLFLQGLYPEFPGFGLSYNQIEKHTTKYACKKSNVHPSGGPPVTKKRKIITAAEEGAMCSVCIDGFEEGQTIRRLKCEHVFHADCVDEWLKRRPTCPNCRLDIRRSPPQNNGTDISPGRTSSPSTSSTNNLISEDVFSRSQNRHRRRLNAISN